MKKLIETIKNNKIDSTYKNKLFISLQINFIDDYNNEKQILTGIELSNKTKALKQLKAYEKIIKDNLFEAEVIYLSVHNFNFYYDYQINNKVKSYQS